MKVRWLIDALYDIEEIADHIAQDIRLLRMRRQSDSWTSSIVSF